MIYTLLIITIVICLIGDYSVVGGLAFMSLIVYTCYRVISWVVRVCMRPAKAEPVFKVSVKVGEPYYNTRIAGVQYRNTSADVGAFLGFVKPDPNNEHDPNAIGIYNNEGKLLGYIPKDDLPDYREWASKDILPCVGFIKEGDEVPLYGKVKIMGTEMEEVELLTAQYVRWMVNKFGLAFIPTDFNIDPAPTSKQHALDILDEYIDKKEADLFEEVDNDD